MRLFISYARVDKHFCGEVIDLLDMHDVWYDQRLHVGQRWWNEIMRRLQWCDGFVYLLSPESIASRYCQKEVEIARRLNKQIFPVAIQPNLEIPGILREFQYEDLSQGLDVNSVKSLLSALYTAERTLVRQTKEIAPVFTDNDYDAFEQLNNVGTKGQTEALIDIINQIGAAMDEANYDMAVFLIKQLMKNDVDSHFINLEELLEEAEHELEKQAYLRQAEHSYRAIKALLQHKSTLSVGIASFKQFKKSYGDYDPENIESLYQDRLGTADEQIVEDWCDIPAGISMIVHENTMRRVRLKRFEISKYPITNRQFQYFIDAPDGYHHGRWWRFSRQAFQWHSLHPTPLPQQNRDNHPRSNICWYEAVAYCKWLSSKTSYDIKLPTAVEWQRAARGDNRYIYPWGNDFNPEYSNTKESQLSGTTAVDSYPIGISPFRVWDMSGNVWEWTRSTLQHPDADKVQIVVKGGAFLSPPERATIDFQYGFSPEYRYNSIGFRIIRQVPDSE